MAIGTPVILVAAYTTTDTTTYTVTPSPAPTRGRLLVCFSDTSHATLSAPTSTPTGLGLDWTLRGSQDHPTDVRRVFAHTAPVHAGLTTGNITLTMTGANLPSTGTGFALVQMSGVDLARPVVRVVSTNVNSTSITLTLPKPLSVANRWLVWKSHRANEVTTPRAAPWVELSDVGGTSPTRAGQVQWLPGVVTSTGILETAASASWATSGQASIIALEMQAARDRIYLVENPQATVTQAAYRFYADGTESGASALAAQDTSYSANIGGGDVNLQTRIRLQGTNTVAPSAGDDWQLQYEKNASGTWTDVIAPPVLADSNTTQTTSSGLTSAQTAVAQSFVGNGQNLSKVRFLLNRVSTPDGTVTAVLYAHSGTYGTSSVPTGAALASSSTFLTSSSITASPTNTWYDFDFDGTFTLGNGTNYCIAAVTTNSTTNAVNVRSSTNSGVHHAGNASAFTGGSWSASAATDRTFELYTGSPITPTNVIPYDSASLTEAEATTNRLGAGTGSFVAGKATEDGLVNDLGWSAGNYTEVLYSLTLVAADLADGDDLLFRVKRNDVANLTYTATPTLAITVGATPVTGTAAVTLAAFTSTATGIETITGTSAQTLADFTSTATGTVGNATGTVAVTLAAFTSTAAGIETISGTSAQTLAAFTSTAAGTVIAPVTGTAAQTLADFTSTASGTHTVTITGTGAQTLANHTSTAAGVVAVAVTGTAAVTLADHTSIASGLHQQNVTGTVAVTLAGHTSTAAGVETITGTSAQTLAAFTSTAAGLQTITGTSAQTLAAFTSTAAGVETITGTVAVILAGHTSTASGVVQANITGTAATTLAGHTSTASGSVTNPITGTAAVTLAGHTSTATGVETFTGTAAVTLEAFTSTAAGIVLTPIVGTAAVTLQDFFTTTTAAPIIATYGPLIRAARPAMIQRTRPVVVTMRRPEDADRDRPVTVELARPGV